MVSKSDCKLSHYFCFIGNNVQLDCSGVKHGIEIDLCPHAYYSCQCETTQSALLTWEVLEEQVYSASALSQAGHFMFQDYEVELSIVHSELETVNNFTSVLWLYSENYPQSNVPVTCSNGIESETYYYKRPGTCSLFIYYIIEICMLCFCIIMFISLVPFNVC